MTIKTISTYEWTDLGVDSGTKVAIQSVNGMSFKLSTQENPSSNDDGITIIGSTIVGIKAGDYLKVLPEFASTLPLQISVQEI